MRAVEQQILHVWAPSTAAADALNKAYGQLDDILTADTVYSCRYTGSRRALRREVIKGRSGTQALKGLKSAEHLQALKESEPQARTT